MNTAFDVETSRFPDGNPYRLSSKCISWAASWVIGPVNFSYWTDPDFKSKLQETLNETTLLIGINLKFDIAWAKRLGCTLPTRVRLWDCQLAEYILSGQSNSFASMEELCERYAIVGKRGGLEEWWNSGTETADIPRAIVEEYNIGDINRTIQIYKSQLKDSRINPKLHKLILLAGADLLVLQQMEENGIHYDVEGSILKAEEIDLEIEEIKQQLHEHIKFEHFNFDSGDHLSSWLYGGVIEVDRFSPITSTYKTGERKGEEYTRNKFQETIRGEFPGIFKPLKRTALKKQGYYQTGEPILRQLPCRTKQQRTIISLLLRLSELSKLSGSFLRALPELCTKMEWGTILHPTYNQCVARTGRLSCSKPNAQQFPEEVDRFWLSQYAG